MPKKLLSSPPDINNILLKGGDFMERQPDVSPNEEASNRIKELRESEVPWGDRPFDSKTLPRVLDERQDPTHPLRKILI